MIVLEYVPALSPVGEAVTDTLPGVVPDDGFRESQLSPEVLAVKFNAVEPVMFRVCGWADVKLSEVGAACRVGVVTGGGGAGQLGLHPTVRVYNMSALIPVRMIYAR